MYSNEECADCMRYDIILNKNKLKLYKLTNDDMNLLEEYAPKIFNTYNGKNLKEVMLDTAILIHNYRNSLFSKEIINLLCNGYPTVNKNKTQKDREEALKNKIEDIRLLLGVEIATTEKGVELDKILKYALKNPQEYFPIIPKIKSSKKEIINYLTNLKLDGKSLIIKEFLKAIK